MRRPCAAAAAGPVSDAAAAGASRLEGQTARPLNLTSGGDRAELSFAEWGRVSSWRVSGVDFSYQPIR